ncbi:MAG: glycosyl transferase group 1 family protein [Candidatus Peribacteria bacterium]|nr:glycosyl transferase group 1 family protein [Candidatus Peribacteria bacterium]
MKTPSLRIAQVSPLYESVPPRLYGGTERVVSYLTEELVRLGHNVTLFASGDSTTTAHLVATGRHALRLSKTLRDPIAPHVAMLGQVIRRISEFDIIHFHCDYLQFLALDSLRATTHLSTLHGRLDIPELQLLYRKFKQVPVNSISQAQRKPLPFLNWQGTAYHGLPVSFYTPTTGQGTYLAFLGRISHEKRPDLAIKIAQKAGMPLKIAAKVDTIDRPYFMERIKPLLGQSSNVDYIGEIGDEEKNTFLGGAAALLFPVRWPEPFGLVMIEAMACGTPVIAYPHGSVPEIIEDGVTGFLVRNTSEAAEAVKKAMQLDRRAIRKRFEERFSATRMCNDYLALYEKMMLAHAQAASGTRPSH